MTRRYTWTAAIQLNVEMELDESEITDDDREWIENDKQYPLLGAAGAAALRIAKAALLEALSESRVTLLDHDLLPNWAEEPDIDQTEGEREPPRFPAPAEAELMAVVERWVAARGGRKAEWQHKRWRHTGTVEMFEGGSVASAYYNNDPSDPDPSDYRVRGLKAPLTLAAFAAALEDL